MGYDERNFVNTRTWQIAHEIVEIALRCDAVIAIERLKNLGKGTGRERSPRRLTGKSIAFHLPSSEWQFDPLHGRMESMLSKSLLQRLRRDVPNGLYEQEKLGILQQQEKAV